MSCHHNSHKLPNHTISEEQHVALDFKGYYLPHYRLGNTLFLSQGEAKCSMRFLFLFSSIDPDLFLWKSNTALWTHISLWNSCRIMTEWSHELDPWCSG